MTPYYQEDGLTIIHGDCLEVIPELSGVHLCIVDPPYYHVVDEEWDHQWKSEGAYLAWVESLLRALDGIIVDNATLYWFAAPLMAGKVEAVLRQHVHVFASCIWDKGQSRQGVAGSGVEVEALRTYWASDHERILVAEKCSQDVKAREASGYEACEQQLKVTLFSQPISEAMQGTGSTAKQVTEAIGAYRMVNHGGAVSNWLLGYNIPTRQQYEAMRAYFHQRSGGHAYLRQDYEELRQDYEELRQDYEELRRPFRAHPWHQWASIWRFPIPRYRVHPTEKPLALMSQIIDISSRPGDLIVDPCMGSGVALDAAKRLGRQIIGIDSDERSCEIAANRLRQGVLALGAD